MPSDPRAAPLVLAQLPSDREGYVPLFTSTEYQAWREADAVGRGGGYVRWLLARRAAQGAEREAKRLKIAERWREVARGERPPILTDELTSLWPETETAEKRAKGKGRVGVGFSETPADPADELLARLLAAERDRDRLAVENRRLRDDVELLEEALDGKRL